MSVIFETNDVAGFDEKKAKMNLKKVTETTEYLVVDDPKKLFVKFDELFLYGDWEQKEQMAYRCYSIFKALKIAKSCSDIHESVTCPEDKILQEIDKKISETQSNTLIDYKIIILPISKQLYEKLSCSSWTSETKFSIDEMCDLLVMLPHFIEKGGLVAFLIFKNLLNDESLYLKLEKIFIAKQSIQKKFSFYDRIAWCANILALVRYNFYFVCENHLGDVVISAWDHERAYKIPLYFKSMEKIPFVISLDYFDVDYKILPNLSLDKTLTSYELSEMTLDIDLTDLFSGNGTPPCVDQLYTEMSMSQRKKIFRELLNNTFLSSEYVKTIVLRISFVIYEIDFSYIAAKLMYLYCDNCKFGALTCLPPKLVELHINNSEINGNLELPEGLDSIVLECTSIHSNVVLTIKNRCRRIEIYKTEGVISFPSIWRLTGIEFLCYYEKVDLWRSSDDLFHLVRIIGALIVKNIELGLNTKILQLINVKMSKDSMVKIHRSCNNIMLKDCAGYFDLSDIVVWGKIKFLTDTNSLKLIRSTTKNTCELLIVNIDYVKSIFTNSDIINLYTSSTMNFDTDLCLKIQRIVEYVTSWNLKYYLDVPFLMFNEIISRRDQGIDYEFYQYDDNGKSKIIIKNAYIQGMVQFIDRNIKEISLINVRVMTGQVLVINTAYESLFMKNCSGRFNIYGIIVSGENCVDLPDTNNHIWFYRVGKDIYNCELSCIPVNKKFTIAHNLQSAKLSHMIVARRASFSFAQGCKNLCLFDCSNFNVTFGTGLKKFKTCSTFDREILYDFDNLDEVYISSCNGSEKATMKFDCIRRIRLYHFKTSRNFLFVINNKCEQILVKYARGRFKTPLIMKSSNITFTLRAGVFTFNQNLTDMSYDLHLENAVIKEIVEIIENIRKLSLKSVIIYRDATLRINSGCETLSISHCEGSIDLMKCDRLKSFTLKNNSFIYYKSVYEKITFLDLENVEINHSIVFNENMKSVRLVNVHVRMFSVLKINKRCETLYIRGCKGNIVISQVDNIGRTQFTKAEKIIALENDPGSCGRSLFLSSMRFYIVEKLPKELKFLIFKNIKIESMSKIIINKRCEYLKLDTCNGCFDVQKAKNLKKVIFVNCIAVFDNHTWKCISLDSDNHNMYKINNITFPDNIRNVVFERIITKKKLIMIINAACEEISIDTCECHFDLSKIVRLRSIKLIYQECHRYEIVLPDLTHVKTLEMSCDKLCWYFKKLLTECINVTKLILHNIKCDLHDQTKTVSCFFPVKDDFSLALSQFMSNSESQNDSSKCNQPTIFAIDLGLYSDIIFKRHRYKTLQYLSISGISLDEHGLKFIKNFIMLKTLSMVLQNILSNIFIALPPGLEKFIITPILCQQNQELKIIPGKILFNENVNMCHKMLKILRIYLGLIVNKSQLVPFLVAIDTLEIIPAIVEWCPDPLNNRKVKVRKLVILKVDCELKKIVEKTSTMDEYYDGVLDLLAYFVDFSDITQIIVQDENSERFVNPSDHMS